MKRIFLLIICLSGFFAYSSAQNIMVKIDDEGHAGYEDENGVEILPCKYDATYPFVKGLGKVFDGEKYGLVDKTGSFVVKPTYNEMEYDMEGGIYRVKSGKEYGVLDSNGQVILKPEYTYISQFNCYGKAILAKGGKMQNDPSTKNDFVSGATFGILNAGGTIAIPAEYKGLYEFAMNQTKVPFKEGTTMLWKKWFIGDTLVTDCKYLGFDKKGVSFYNAGILDENGQEVVPLNTADWLMKPCNGMVRYYKAEKTGHSVGYYDISSQSSYTVRGIDGMIAATKYWTHTDFMDEIAAVNVDDKWSIIDKSYNTKISDVKNIAKSTTCGLWQILKSDGSVQFLDRGGNPVFEGAGFTNAFFPRNQRGTDFNYIGVEKNGKWGLIDLSGQEIIPFEYERVNDCRYGCVQVKQNGKWGLVTLKNEVVVPAEYDLLAPLDRENPKIVLVGKADKLWYIYNTEKKQEMGRGYARMGYFNDGLAWARPADMTVEDNNANRLMADGTPEVKNFAYVIDEDGNELVKTPVPTKSIEDVRKWMDKTGHHELNEMETWRLILQLTSRKRHYPMDTKIGEGEWDY